VTPLEKLGAMVVRRTTPVILAGAAGEFLIAGAGVSAHTGSLPFFPTPTPPVVHQSHSPIVADVPPSALRPDLKATPLPSVKPALTPPPAMAPQLKPPPLAQPTEKPETSADPETGESGDD